MEKLADRGLIVLPALKPHMGHPRPKPGRAIVVDWPREPVTQALSELLPLEWIVPKAGQEFSSGRPRRRGAAALSLRAAAAGEERNAVS